MTDFDRVIAELKHLQTECVTAETALKAALVVIVITTIGVTVMFA